MYIGQSVNRLDAVDKVTGKAQYTQDFAMPGILHAKVVRSTIANGKVLSVNCEKARALKGVVAVYTCFDVPDIQFPTAGHPWSVDPKHQDIADRKLLNERVRYYGDDVAVVVARDNVIADRAARLVEVEYEEYEPLLDMYEAIKEDAMPLHPDVRPTNVIVRSSFKVGEENFDDLKDKGYYYLEGKYKTQQVQHCHIELPVSRAFVENDKVTVISSTQIPHITRRVCSQALGLPVGKIRIIKPYIGGGFGNKQDVLYEPLNAWLAYKLQKPVELFITREETFTSTRTRHKIETELKTYVDKDGRLIGRSYVGYADNGGYASHGHAICANCANEYRMLYQDEKVLDSTSYTIYTNKPTAGAMRAYGVPQCVFMMESHMDDLAKLIGKDPIEFREKNMMKLGYVDPVTGIRCHSNKLQEAINYGREYIQWDKKRKEYANDKGTIRRGVGMAIFTYKTGVYPIALETATVRFILNQDGSCQVQMGATEIGQGATTVFAQMAADELGFSLEKVHMVQAQDTDTTPFDTSAYASRQTYVSGMALQKAAKSFKEKILKRYLIVAKSSIDINELNIVEDNIVKGEEVLMSMEELAMNATYSLEDTEHITANETNHCTSNTYSFGCTFVDIEVDTKLGKVEIKDVINVHDSGKIINPKLAAGQVHGGMSMCLGYTFGEDYKYDAKGKVLNANLLDYKIPTAMDHPDLNIKFIESYDESAPYGNKSLGEPPAITMSAAVRNAILHATGVAVNELPLNPQRLLAAFEKAEL